MTESDFALSDDAVQMAVVQWLCTRPCASGTLLRCLGFGEHPADVSGRFAYAAGFRCGGNGESEVVIEWKTPDGKRLRLLIEVRVVGNLREWCGAAYHDHMAARRAGTPDLVVRSILIAPSEYLLSVDAAAHEFDRLIPLEFFMETGAPDDPGIPFISAALKQLADVPPVGPRRLFLIRD